MFMLIFWRDLMSYIKQKDLRDYFHAIRNYNKAIKRYLKGSPSTTEASNELKLSYLELMLSLNNPKLQKLINDNIEKIESDFNKTKNTDDIIKQLTNGSEVSELEKSLADNFGMSKNDVMRLIASYEKSNNNLHKFSITDIKLYFEGLQNHLISEVPKVRKVGKKDKKARKRDLLRGAFSTTFGAGIAAANTLMPSTYLFSYSIAAIAIHQGIRDFIGDPS